MSRVGARGDEAGEDPGREPAEPGRENLVGADAHTGGDAVGGEAVRGAGDPARDPGAVALEVAVAAVAQPGAVDDAEAEERLQVVAGDEVAAERRVEHAAQLAVVRLDARVEDRDRDRAVAGRAAARRTATFIRPSSHWRMPSGLVTPRNEPKSCQGSATKPWRPSPGPPSGPRPSDGARRQPRSVVSDGIREEVGDRRARGEPRERTTSSAARRRARRSRSDRRPRRRRPR